MKGYKATDIKYYECHITIEPVVGDRYDLFSRLCGEFNFKPAKLVMIKNRLITNDRSNKDSFCTGHAQSCDDIFNRMNNLRHKLHLNDFEVWRCKIEAIVFDEKYERLSVI